MENLDLLPADLRPGLVRYIEQRVMPGRFLQACLENDLLNAACRADGPARLAQLPTIMRWLYNEAPSASWGNREKVRAWLAGAEG